MFLLFPTIRVSVWIYSITVNRDIHRFIHFRCDLYRHQHIFHMNQPTAEDPNRCNICNVTVNSWQAHRKTARRPNYKCTLCPIIYRTKQGLEVHLRTNHSNCATPAPVKFQCNLCKKIMIDQISMEAHVSFHSTRPRPFQCGVNSNKTYRF